VKLIIRINQAERESMQRGIFPNTFPSYRIISEEMPDKANHAGILETAILNKTIKNAPVDFIAGGRKGMVITDNPADKSRQ